jgi:Protein of unknown function (DUF2934)
MSTKTAPQVHNHLRGQTNAAAHEERFRLIQVRAYGLWEQAGKPNDDGSRERFWHEAEKAITGDHWPLLTDK